MTPIEIQKKKVDITPDVSLLPKLGHSGYRLAEALAEFVDNSLDAKLEDQQSVAIDIQISEKRISIFDDGCGMDEQTAINSLKLAYSKKEDKLGEFGLGLKTAAISLGKKFKIRTTRRGAKNWFVLEYDEDKWKSVNDWKSQELQIFPKENEEEHGTEITIYDLKINYYPNLITNSKKQLAFRFAPYLENGVLQIKINTMYLDAPYIELAGGKTEIKLDLGVDKVITGWYGFLKKRNGQHYGFNLYKHGRLIRAEEKFGFEPHAEIALLYGSLDLDFVPTTHNKREFIESSFEYKLAEETFKKYLKDNKVTVKARDLSFSLTTRKKKEKVDENLEEFFNAVIKVFKDAKQEVEIEELPKPLEIKNKEEIEKIKLLHQDREFNLHNFEEGKTYELKILGRKYNFKFDLTNLGREKDLVQYYREKNTISIIINIDFPFYEFVVKDYHLYSLFLISESIAEIVVTDMRLEQSKLIQIRNLMLRRYGEMQKEVLESEEIEKEERRILEKMRVLEEKKKLLSK